MTRWEYLEVRGDFVVPYSAKSLEETVAFFNVAFEDRGSSFEYRQGGLFSTKVGNAEIINALGFLGWEAVSVDFQYPGFGPNRRPPLFILMKRPMEFQDISPVE